MFQKIDELLVNTLQEKIKLVPKEQITNKHYLKIDRIPAISVNNIFFEAKDIGIGRMLPPDKSEILETFSGDGVKTEFTFSKQIFRSQTTVEHPPETKLSENQYTMDYKNNKITLKTPPKKGKENLIVKYTQTYEMKSIKIDSKYHITILTEDQAQLNEVTMEVVQILLLEEEMFNKEKIAIRLNKGFNIYSKIGSKEALGRILEYLIETELFIKTPYPKIEEIEVRKK